VWGRLAEICGEYLTKGKMVYIEGSIKTRAWEDSGGNKKWTTEIIARNMQMLGLSKERPEPSTVPSKEVPEDFDVLDDSSNQDIPF